MYRFVVLHCVARMNGWMPSLSSMLVVYCLSSGFVGVCSYARLSGSQHGLSSFVSCLLQSEKRGVSALSGQRGAKRNPADSNKHQQHIVKFTGLRKQASCKAVYQVGRDNTKAGQTRTISLVMIVFCINKMWLFIWEVVFGLFNEVFFIYLWFSTCFHQTPHLIFSLLRATAHQSGPKLD